MERRDLTQLLRLGHECGGDVAMHWEVGTARLVRATYKHTQTNLKRLELGYLLLPGFSRTPATMSLPAQLGSCSIAARFSESVPTLTLTKHTLR